MLENRLAFYGTLGTPGKNWMYSRLVNNTKDLKVSAFTDNHYAGHGPDDRETVPAAMGQ
jgi:hypothetical protein